MLVLEVIKVHTIKKIEYMPLYKYMAVHTKSVTLTNLHTMNVSRLPYENEGA